MAPADRTVLFLQGPPTPFWSELGDAVAARGAQVRRINLNAGDALFWRRGGADSYRGRLSGWRRWLSAYVAREGVTDILYFADRLPYHRIAQKVARAAGIGAYAIEFGYLRPDWLTLEREGGGAYSHFTDDPAQLDHDASAPDFASRHGHPFAQEAVGEVLYNLSATFGRPLYPWYAADKYYPPVFDYLCWLAKMARGRAAKRHAATVEAACLDGEWPYALLALQLQSDYQLRACAPYRHQSDMLAEVIASFAAHAAPDQRLVIKLHPLDNGWENWPKRVARLAARHGVADRVLTLDGGDLNRLIRGATGVVMINSTVGIHALRVGAPVKALGAAIYAMPGLTDPGPLDRFWTAPQPPDPTVVAAFLATLAGQIQFKGSFYQREGRRIAAEAMAARLLEGRVGPPGPQPPARLTALRAARRARGLV